MADQTVTSVLEDLKGQAAKIKADNKIEKAQRKKKAAALKKEEDAKKKAVSNSSQKETESKSTSSETTKSKRKRKTSGDEVDEKKKHKKLDTSKGGKKTAPVKKLDTSKGGKKTAPAKKKSTKSKSSLGTSSEIALMPSKSSKSKGKRSKSTKRQTDRKGLGNVTNADNKPPVEQRRRRKKKKKAPPSNSAKPAPPSPDSDTSDEEVLDDRFCSQMKLLPYSPDSLDYDRGEYVLDSEIDKVSIPANETLLSRLEFGDGVFVRRSSRNWAYGIFVESEVFITREYKVQFACSLRTKGQFIEKGSSYFEGESLRLIKGSRHLSSG